jgi:hypothetical protein
MPYFKCEATSRRVLADPALLGKRLPSQQVV